MKNKTKKSKATKPSGPKPEILKIDGNWQDGMKKLLAKKKSAGGWPKS